MTDKQIIIDGVDVSGCPNFTFNKIEPNESICISEQSAMCVNNKDCLYKKWKRKEQECEELRKEINGYKIIIEKIRQEVQEDVTCESRECGCDSYEECIECLKNTILNIIFRHYQQCEGQKCPSQSKGR